MPLRARAKPWAPSSGKRDPESVGALPDELPALAGREGATRASGEEASGSQQGWQRLSPPCPQPSQAVPGRRGTTAAPRSASQNCAPKLSEWLRIK
eukprot:9224113-Pyramimonas_sp.AAC.1